jgi:hypothetical protein
MRIGQAVFGHSSISAMFFGFREFFWAEVLASVLAI